MSEDFSFANSINLQTDTVRALAAASESMGYLILPISMRGGRSERTKPWTLNCPWETTLRWLSEAYKAWSKMRGHMPLILWVQLDSDTEVTMKEACCAMAFQTPRSKKWYDINAALRLLADDALHTIRREFDTRIEQKGITGIASSNRYDIKVYSKQSCEAVFKVLDLPENRDFLLFGKNLTGQAKSSRLHESGSMWPTTHLLGSTSRPAVHTVLAPDGYDNFPTEWLIEKLDIAEVERKFLSDGRWIRMKNRMEQGDEVWSFSSPDESWQHLAGRKGIALVRNGHVIGSIVTIMN